MTKILKKAAAVCIAIVLAVQTAVLAAADTPEIEEIFSLYSSDGTEFYDNLQFGDNDWAALCRIRLYGRDGADEYIASVKSEAERQMSSEGFVKPTELQRAAMILAAVLLLRKKRGLLVFPLLLAVAGAAVLLLEMAVALSEGASAFDALVEAAKTQQLRIGYSGGAFGEYVTEIGGLCEFSCGSESGWFYNVNGEYPNLSVGVCTLSAHDNVEFVYTCTLGQYSTD